MGQLVFITKGAGGGGTVIGTGTDNHLVRWDGTGVPLIQDSNWVLDDLGNMTVLPNIYLATMPNQFEPINPNPFIQGPQLLIRGSDADNIPTFPPNSVAGTVKLQGGKGGDATLGGGVALGGGFVIIEGGAGGAAPDGFGPSGGAIYLRPGPVAGLDPNTSRSFIILAPPFRDAVNTDAGAFILAGGLLQGAIPAEYLTNPQLFAGGAHIGGGLDAPRGGHLLLHAGNISQFDGAFAGNANLAGGQSRGLDSEVTSKGGTAWVSGGRAYLNDGDNTLLGFKSGDVQITLSTQHASANLGVPDDFDGGILFSGADGIAYWRLHDLSPNATGEVGSQRLHLMTAAQELAIEPIFAAVVPPVGFLHYQLEDITPEQTFPNPDSNGGYQYGFRGHRNGVTRSIARIYTLLFTAADLIPSIPDGPSDLLVLNHNLGTDCPLVQVWKDLGGDGTGPFMQATPDAINQIATLEKSDPDFGNVVNITFAGIVVPITGTWRVTVSGY